MDDSNVSWEEVLEKAGIREWDCKPSDYKKISPDDPLYKDYAQCSHVLIYARTNSTSLDLYERRAIVLLREQVIYHFGSKQRPPNINVVHNVWYILKEFSKYTLVFGTAYSSTQDSIDAQGVRASATFARVRNLGHQQPLQFPWALNKGRFPSKKSNETPRSKVLNSAGVPQKVKVKTRGLVYWSGTIIAKMQVRFDGFLGFPGGFVDPGETPVEALNRELREESGWFEDRGPITAEHYLFTHAHEGQKMVLHFYGIEVSEEKIKEIEASTLKASDYGEEVLGSCRVPLYTMGDAYRGFPSFLHNNFIGNAKVQLIQALVSLKFLTAETVIQAVNSKPLVIS